MMKIVKLCRGKSCENVACVLFAIAALTLGAVAQTPLFSVQKTPSPNPRGNSLNAVAALSTADAWAVGYQNDNNLNGSRTLIQHWNGTSWMTVKSPDPGNTAGCGNSNTGNVLN